MYRQTRDAVRKILLSNVHRRVCSLAGAPAIISFTFDDFPRSALLNGGPILRDAGARGTFYASPCLMNTTTEMGQNFGEDDLHALLAEGHELGSHTSSHCSARRVASAAYRGEIVDGHTALGRLVGGNISPHFSYPFGHMTFGVKRVVGEVTATCRSTYHGVNGPVADLNLLFAHRMYGPKGSLPLIEQVIARGVQPGRWLIFYTHDVAERPSPYGCTPDFFATVVRWAVASGAKLMTVGAALATITGKAAPQVMMAAATADV